MVIRICFVAFEDRIKSIGAESLSEMEFQAQINKISPEKIEVARILQNFNDRSINFRKISWLPKKLSFSLTIFSNIPYLMKQDIFIMSTITSRISLIICLFCKLCGKKSMITIHGFYDEEWLKLGRSKLYISCRKFLANINLKIVDMVVVNDVKLKEKLVSKTNCYLLVRELFVDTEKFSRNTIDAEELSEIKSAYKIPDKYILFIGYLDEWDGILDLLTVFKIIHDELPEYKCLIVGNERVDKKVIKYKIDAFINTNNLNDSIIFTGRVDHDVIKYFLYGAHITILPMHPPQAGVGRIILESLSMEIPVITYDIGVINKVVIDNKTGFCVQLGNLGLMASKAIFLLKNPDIRKKFGSAGRMIVQSRYSLNEYIHNWMDSIKLLNNNY
jgi:glycosyltransferase involved in cell wall biosynthesis